MKYVPTKLGVPVQFDPELATLPVEYQPCGGELTSTLSEEFRPKVGVPQTTSASLV